MSGIIEANAAHARHWTELVGMEQEELEQNVNVPTSR
jgi:hypothetical protein